MPSTHLILCYALLLLPSIFPSIRVFSSELSLRIRWPTYWSFSISPSNEYSQLISFRSDWFDPITVQGTPKSLLQHHSSKVSVLWYAHSRLIRKDPDTGEDWRQDVKGAAEDEMVGWHHRLNGHDFEQAPGDRQESLLCCGPWDLEESRQDWGNNNSSSSSVQSLSHVWLFVTPWTVTVCNNPSLGVVPKSPQ